MDPVKHFDLVFGGIFALIGMVGLIAGAVVCIVFVRRPPKERVTWLFVCLPLGLGVLFTLIGGLWGGGALDQLHLEERLRTSGVTIQATVVDVERTGSRLNGRHLWRIRYEYQDPAGRLHEGVSGYMERGSTRSVHRRRAGLRPLRSGPALGQHLARPRWRRPRPAPARRRDQRGVRLTFIGVQVRTRPVPGALHPSQIPSQSAASGMVPSDTAPSPCVRNWHPIRI